MSPRCARSLSTTPRRRGVFRGETSGRRQLGDLVFVDSRHERGSVLPRHRHDFPYFCLNHGGTYTETYGRKTRVCCPGMLVIHPAGEFHSEVHESDVASLNVEVGPDWLRRVFDFAGPLELGEYSRQRRLEHARRLLSQGQLSLAEVAQQAGFADQAHLTRTFRRYVGLTPAQYRTFHSFKTR